MAKWGSRSQIHFKVCVYCFSWCFRKFFIVWKTNSMFKLNIYNPIQAECDTFYIFSHKKNSKVQKVVHFEVYRVIVQCSFRIMCTLCHRHHFPKTSMLSVTCKCRCAEGIWRSAYSGIGSTENLSLSIIHHIVKL